MTNLPRPRPQFVTLEGARLALVPLVPAHAADLYAAVPAADRDARYRFLPETPPASVEDVVAWAQAKAGGEDPMFWACVERATGRVRGRQSLMRITPEHGVIEIGHILWGAGMAQTPLATEALYLAASYVFDTLGYRRFEWKCDALNAPSRRAAVRFGFEAEGVFRQHLWIKGRNRDTAWFAMLDGDWPGLAAGYRRWLAPANFDAAGRQRERLCDCLARDG